VTKIIYAVQGIRESGETYWIDCETEKEIASPPANIATVAEAHNLNRVLLSEPSNRPLTETQKKMKEHAKLMNLSEAEAEIYARGRE